MINFLTSIILLIILPALTWGDMIFLGRVDLNKMAQEFVLEKKQIKIPEYPFAFNPSIVRWNNSLLMSFRVQTNANNVWHSRIGLVWLDKNFKPISTPTLLDTRARLPLHPSKSEDARLFTVGDRLYIIYNDNEEYHDEGLRRMYFSEVVYDGENFSVSPECINSFEGESKERWEKNWIPFDYEGTMLFAYTILPHKIFLPLFGHGACETVALTTSPFLWPWGPTRIYGGTPALKVNDYYLAFFHSSCHLNTIQTGNYETWHYFMGAYLFNSQPPFAITMVSPQPIMSKGLYDNPLLYKRVIFPGGFIYDDKYIWISYGREDCECWIIKLDKQGLLNSLVPVSAIIEH